MEFKRQAIRYVDGKRHVLKTYQSPAQKEWQAAVESVGYKYAVVRSLEEFIQLINSYLNDLI